MATKKKTPAKKAPAKKKPARKRQPLVFNSRKRIQFLTWLVKLGYVSTAARKCKIAPRTVYKYAEDNPVFKEIMEQARDEHTDHMATEYADQALNGVTVEREVIVKGRIKKLKIRRKWPYLLARYVESRHADFKKRGTFDEIEGFGVLAVQPASTTAGEFFEKFGAPEEGSD